MAEIEFKPEYIDRLEPQALAECVDPDTAAIMREIFRRARAYQPPATPGPSIGEAARQEGEDHTRSLALADASRLRHNPQPSRGGHKEER